MTSNKIYFFFDYNTLEILGHFVFQGTLNCVYSSEDGEDIIFEIEDYCLIPGGDITPIRKDGVLTLKVDDVIGKRCNVYPCGEWVDFPSGVDRFKIMRDKINDVVENAVRNVSKEIGKLKKKLSRHEEEKNPCMITFLYVRNKYPS